MVAFGRIASYVIIGLFAYYFILRLPNILNITMVIYLGVIVLQMWFNRLVNRISIDYKDNNFGDVLDVEDSETKIPDLIGVIGWFLNVIYGLIFMLRSYAVFNNIDRYGFGQLFEWRFTLIIVMIVALPFAIYYNHRSMYPNGYFSENKSEPKL